MRCLGKDALDILDTLPYDRSEDRRDLSKALTLLEKHFMGGTTVTYESFLCLKQDQLPDESFAEYLTGLRTLASKCEFGSLLDD